MFRDGKGTFSYKNGDLYTGKFDNDEFNGKGKISFGSLDVYEGDFIDGRLEGHGVMEYKVSIISISNEVILMNISQDGTIHEGTWLGWKRRGNGTATYRNGS